MNNEVRKETNLEHYKEELKEGFRTNWMFPGVMVARVNKKFGANISSFLEDGSPYVTDRLLDWMAQPYKEPILDDVEKSYLRSVVKPFRGKVNYIYKTSCGKKRYYIRIVVRSVLFPNGLDSMQFPAFTGETMYKGMKLNKAYTLKELGL